MQDFGVKRPHNFPLKPWASYRISNLDSQREQGQGVLIQTHMRGKLASQHEFGSGTEEGLL